MVLASCSNHNGLKNNDDKTRPKSAKIDSKAMQNSCRNADQSQGPAQICSVFLFI